jgi:hypothetical protein
VNFVCVRFNMYSHRVVSDIANPLSQVPAVCVYHAAPLLIAKRSPPRRDLRARPSSMNRHTLAEATSLHDGPVPVYLMEEIASTRCCALAALPCI